MSKFYEEFDRLMRERIYSLIPEAHQEEQIPDDEFLEYFRYEGVMGDGHGGVTGLFTLMKPYKDLIVGSTYASKGEMAKRGIEVPPGIMGTLKDTAEVKDIAKKGGISIDEAYNRVMKGFEIEKPNYTEKPKRAYWAAMNNLFHNPDYYSEPVEEAKKGARCTKVTKKASSPLKNKKWTKCAKQSDGSVKRIHWGDPNAKVTGKSGNTKRKKSFRARHKCSTAKKGTPRAAACSDW